MFFVVFFYDVQIYRYRVLFLSVYIDFFFLTPSPTHILIFNPICFCGLIFSITKSTSKVTFLLNILRVIIEEKTILLTRIMRTTLRVGFPQLMHKYDKKSIFIHKPAESLLVNHNIFSRAVGHFYF